MYTNNTGKTVKTKSSFSRTFKRDVPDAHRHLRVGHFSICVTRGSKDVWVSKSYDTDGLENFSFLKDAHLRSSMTDRTSQLNSVASVISKSHPRYAEVSKDIANERSFWKKMCP